VRLATHAAVELAARLDETIGVAVWGTHGPTVLHWEPSSRPVSMSLRAGAVLPLLRSATGRVFAAWLPDEVLAPFVAAEAAASVDGGETGEPGTRRLTAEVRRVRESVRRDGIAVLDQVASFLDRSAVAVAAASVPVFDSDGRILLALTALGESGHIDVSAGAPVPRALAACARELARTLGGGAAA